MAEIRRSTLATAVLATAGSLGLHAALLSVALRLAEPAVESPPRAPVILSLPGPALMRPAAVEPPAEAVDAPPLPVPAPIESVTATPAGLAEVPSPGPQAADARGAEPAAVPPAPADATAVVSDAPAAAEPAPPSRLFEATSPARVAAPPDLLAPAAAPKVVAPQERAPPIPVDQVDADRSRAALPVQLPPAIGSTREPAAVALREASPDAGPTLSPLPLETSPSTDSGPRAVVPAPAVPPPAAEPPPAPAEAVSPAIGAPSTAAAPSEAPPALGAVQTTGPVVAALEAPTVSAERIRGFVERYDGGPCFFASVTGTGSAGAGIETFSATVDKVMAFHSAFMGQLGVEPVVVGQRVWKAQCPAVEFLRRTQADRTDPLALRLDRREGRSGEVISIEVRGAGERHVEVILVSEVGIVTGTTEAARLADGTMVFTISLPVGPPGGPYPEMVIATADVLSLRSHAAPLSSPRSPTARSVAELLLVRR